MKSAEVPRAGRLLDMVGVLVFLLGAALYARAWMGMRGLPGFVPASREAFPAMARYQELLALSRIGLTVMAAGALTAVAAAVVARRLARSADGA